MVPEMVIKGKNASINITNNGLFSTPIKTELEDEVLISKKEVRS